MQKEERWWDFPSTIFLAVALLLCSGRLSSSGWAEELGRTNLLVVIGFGIGLLLGLSSFKPRLAGLFGFLYTLFFIPWQLLIPIPSVRPWADRLLALTERVYYNIQQLAANQPLSDPILFLASMYLLFWLLGLFGGYQLTRYARPWVSLIIAGIGLLIMENRIGQPSGKSSDFTSVFFILLGILLVAQIYYLKLARHWEKKSVIVESGLRYDLGRGALLAGLLVLVVTWNIPSLILTLTPGSEPNAQSSKLLNDIERKFQHFFEPLTGPRIVEVDYMGRNLDLGPGQPLSDQVVFTVTVKQNRPSGVSYYWRGRTYDYYEDGEWQNTLSRPVRYTTNTTPYTYPWTNRQPLDFTFTAATNVRSLYTPGALVAIDQPVEIWLDRLANDQVDIQGLIKTENLSISQSYTINALVAAPTIRDLRNAGENYPPEILEAYLQLPDDLPERIRLEAQKIAGDEPTPYDKTIAITNYLRQEMEYTPTIPQIPQQRDPVDWFLFTGKRGFCNYYASAEVLMLRSLGVPARLAAGYARGEGDSGGQNFTVRQKDSHAWPEIYFPDIGWVEFEPTTALSGITRLSGEEARPTLDLTDAESLRDRPMLDDEFPRLPEEAQKQTVETAPPLQPAATARQPIIVSLTISILGVSAALLYVGRRKIVQLPIRLSAFYQTRTHRPPPAWLQSWSLDAIQWLDRPLPRLHFTPPPLIARMIQRAHLRLPPWIQRSERWLRANPIERDFIVVDLALHWLGQSPLPAQTPAERVTTLIKYLPEAEQPALTLLQAFQTITYSHHSPQLPENHRAAQQVLFLAARAWLRRAFSFTGID